MSSDDPATDADASTLEPRTKRARNEDMTVALRSAGGIYSVTGESGRTYRVDITRSDCTCPDQQRRAVERCKHLRRVDMEIRNRTVPTPDGRLPERPVADGGVGTEQRETGRSENESRIEGADPGVRQRRPADWLHVLPMPGVWPGVDAETGPLGVLSGRRRITVDCGYVVAAGRGVRDRGAGPPDRRFEQHVIATWIEFVMVGTILALTAVSGDTPGAVHPSSVQTDTPSYREQKAHDNEVIDVPAPLAPVLIEIDAHSNASRADNKHRQFPPEKPRRAACTLLFMSDDWTGTGLEGHYTAKQILEATSHPSRCRG